MPQPIVQDEGAFPNTRWSLVARGRVALEELYRTYYPALKAHLTRVKRLEPDHADELIQGFIASQVLEKEFFERADRALGKFRTYLLTALDRYRLKQYRDSRAQKRSPRDGKLMGVEDAGDLAALEESFKDVFDVEWARQTLDEAVRLMRKETERGRRSDVWQVFERRLLEPLLRGVEPPSYDDLVRDLNLESPTQAMNLLVTAKRSFGRAVREVLSRYAAPGEEVESELTDLINTLAKSPSVTSADAD